MKVLLVGFFCWIMLLQATAQYKLHYAMPVIQYKSVFFTDTAMVNLKFEQPGTSIHFTTNGKTPTEKDAVYTQPIVVKGQNSTIKAIVFGSEFLPSDVLVTSFYNKGLAIPAVTGTLPDAKYKANGLSSLTDNIGGFAQLNTNWLGYTNDTIQFFINLDGKQTIHEVALNFLQDEGSWIFLPTKISLFAYNNKLQEYALKKTVYPFTNLPGKGSNCVFTSLSLPKKISTQKLMVLITTLKKIPDWHPAKGEHAWTFIDELKVY